MYTEEYEKRGFPFRNFLLKLILIIVFVFLLCWLLPKFMVPAITKSLNENGKNCTTATCENSGIKALTSQIFADNLEKMKNAAISYYTNERLPKNVGESDKMTLSDMIGKKIITPLIDKNNKAVDVEKSYVKITKVDDEYILKVNIKDSEKEDYILVHLGCYNYCGSGVCQKQGTENVPLKAGKSTSTSTTTYVPVIVERPEMTVYCVKYDGKYYDNTGKVVSYDEYKKSCLGEVKHICVKHDGKFYDKNGNAVSYDEYKKSCFGEQEHYCVKYDGKYYDKAGKVVSESEYKKSCFGEQEHYCVKYDGKYYDKTGKVVSESEYKKSCFGEEKHYCVKYDGKYYDKNGNAVSYDEYKKSCFGEEKHICVKYQGNYYDKTGKKVTYEEYKKSCVNAKEYLYEYKKVTKAKFSAWTNWSAWSKTNCSTQEINCNDMDITCLKKLQMYTRKEKIGTYEKAYAKQRQVVRQTGAYTEKACSKYNYVIINNTTYATTTTTKYTQTNVITSSTRSSVGGWTYVGRQLFSNPPRDTATTHYKFAGADYSYCTDTCTTLPNYYYDVYNYTGGLTTVSNTTSTPTSTSTSSTSSSTSTTVDASCGEYVTKTIPIYSTITVTEKATRQEPLYGDVCYQSTKTRKLISNETTQVKWSKYNDTTLLNSGWSYTGKIRVK